MGKEVLEGQEYADATVSAGPLGRPKHGRSSGRGRASDWGGPSPSSDGWGGKPRRRTSG